MCVCVCLDDTEGKGIEVAYSEMVALVLGRTLDVEVLLGLLEEVMLKAGYDLNFVSDSSGFVAGYVAYNQQVWLIM